MERWHVYETVDRYITIYDFQKCLLSSLSVTKSLPQTLTFFQFLAVISSSRSDHVTPFVRPFVLPSVRNVFFYFAFTSLLGQDLWHWWSLKWPRTTVKVSQVLPKQMCGSLQLKYEIWIRPLQLKFDIECFAFDFWRLKLAFCLRFVCCLLKVEAI